MRCKAAEHAAMDGDGHDWVPVPRDAYADLGVMGKYPGKRLWECPCDAFKWTSYAEWEGRQPTVPPGTIIEDRPAAHPEEERRRRAALEAWDEKQREERESADKEFREV